MLSGIHPRKSAVCIVHAFIKEIFAYQEKRVESRVEEERRGIKILKMDGRAVHSIAGYIAPQNKVQAQSHTREDNQT
jgi:hypothetical protein